MIKDRPDCRHIIEHILFNCRYANLEDMARGWYCGKPTFISEGMRKQAKKMLKEKR